MARLPLEIADHLLYYCIGDNCPCCDWSDEDRAALEAMSIDEADRIAHEATHIAPARCDDADCADCKTNLAAGHQSSDNLSLCQGCADYRQQGEERGNDFEDHVDGGRYDLSDDAEALASAGWGTDEDYFFGDTD